MSTDAQGMEAEGRDEGSGPQDRQPGDGAAGMRPNQTAEGLTEQEARVEGHLAERPYQPGDSLPAVGSECLVSGVNGDIESDQHRGYSWRRVIGYSEGDTFVCLQTRDCWPTVERLANCWFAEVPQARAAVEVPTKPAEVPGAYEVRDDGKTVRRDRWQMGIRRIVALLWGNRHEFEIDEVVEAVRKLVPEPFNEGDDEGFFRSVVCERATPPAPLLPGVLTDEAVAIMDALMLKSDCALDRNGEFAAVSAWKIKAAGGNPVMQPMECLSAAAPPQQQDLGDALRPELSAALRSAAISIAAPDVRRDE